MENKKTHKATGTIQTPLWVARKRLSVLRTAYKNVSRKYEEDLERRRQDLADAEAHVEFLEAQELDEMSL